MNYEGINEKLKDLRVEEFVWIIYAGIIVFSFYSNSLERKYFLYNEEEYRKKYRSTLIIIFSILVIVYLYFLKGSYDNLKELNAFSSPKTKNLVYLTFIASLLIAISGFIFLYVAYMDESIDVELAFN